MKSAPSAAFRQLCLAMALLVGTWVRPARVQADAYPLNTELVTANALRPNVLIVLETVETMQGLPGENQARYNEVGSDCEDGNRECRLVGQVGRWEYSGMGSHGISFGDPNAICTSTVTNTTTNTTTETQTGTGTATYTLTDTSSTTSTATATNTGTRTQTGTGSNTITNTATRTGTASNTATQTDTNTATGTNTGTATGTNTATQTGTNTATGTNTGTATGTNTATQTGTNTATNTNTGTATGTGTQTASETQTSTSTNTQTGTSATTRTFTGTRTLNTTAGWTWTGSAYHQQIANTTGTGTWVSNVPNGNYNMNGSANAATLTGTDSSGFTTPYTGTATGTAVISSPGVGTVTYRWTDTGASNRTVTATGTWIESAGTLSGTFSSSATFTASRTISSTITGTTTNTATGTQTNTKTNTNTNTTTTTNTATATNTTTATQTNTATQTGTNTATTTNTGTATQTNTATQTGTNTATTTNTGTGTQSNTTTQSTTNTSTGTNTGTGTQTNTTTESTTTTAVVTNTDTITNTSSWTATGTETGTGTSTHQYPCGTAGSTDTTNCDPAVPTTIGFCSVASGVVCGSEAACTDVQGDFCRHIAATDQSGRHYNEPCIASAGTPWGSCKHGVVTANTTCSSGSTSCGNALSGDYCAEGQPAKMCADSGLWCSSAPECPGDALTDTCSGATSRMMTVKRALRRAMSEYADKVEFGFMSSYQGKGIGATNASTEIFPYVQLQSCPTSANITETKFISRGELEQAGCFSLTGGPSTSCTIDSGGNGALNTDPTLNRISYSLVGTGDCPGSSDSRWEIRRGDGSGKSNHADGTWSSCSASAPLCTFSGGTGLYEGSYYCFKYKQGEPITSGEGSMAQPKYFTSYKGKFYDAGGGLCYNAIDAQRSDIVNDNVFGRPAYTGQSWSADHELQVPWGGANSALACDATDGAIWHSNVVPFLTDTTFGGKTITPAQKALMMTARLEKASFGGLAATGSVEPVACVLKNDGSPDRYHSAADYMTGTSGGVQSNDFANNGNKTPCWNNGIILVVDGQPNGLGDIGADVHCTSEACAHSESSTLFQGCACPAIVKAYNLAHSSAPVQTHVVVNAPNAASDSLSWKTRYEYTHGFLTNLAKAGSPNFDGTPSFGTTEDEVYRAISDKIAAIAYHFTYTTTVPVAGATTQNPDTKVLTYSNYLYDAGTNYPSWKGTVRAYDTSSGAAPRWDAATIAAAGYPANWTYRRIYFSNQSGQVARVQVSSNDAATATISNASALALHDAGLGASSDEANKIMQWLLGKPGLGNPTPLMGSVTSSVPLVVAQAAANGLNGSAQYSQATWRRPPLVYVGADDGMLHAFFAHLGTVTLNGAIYQGGEEAFAFIPNDMLPVITKLFAQGGQKLPVDKAQHIFGLASSPKVKDICIGTACQSSTGSGWHTVLVMPEGPGGNQPFELDITNVIDATSGLHPENMSLRWSVAAPSTGSGGGPPTSSDITKWQHLGETTSVPAFYFAGFSPSTGADNRVVFASGYPVSATPTHQGLYLVNADAANGAVKDSRDLSAISVPSSCGQTRTFMADVALARDFSSELHSQYLIAGYVADTWGNTYQYVPAATDPAKVLTLLDSRGCDQPIYFAPALVQIDRVPNPPSSAKRMIYLVQVTNSNLDPDTMTNGHGSQMVVTKLDGTVTLSPPTIVTSYNSRDPNGRGQIVLSTDSADPAMQICIQTSNTTSFSGGMKTSGNSCAQAGGQAIPATARPVGTPTSVLRSDGFGFQVITAWFDPDPGTRSNDCSNGKQYNYGTSYVTVHEFGADATWYQIAGITLNNTVLTGVAFIATGLFIDGLTSGSTPQSLSIGETFSTMQQILNNATQDRYSRRAWTEFGL